MRFIYLLVGISLGLMLTSCADVKSAQPQSTASQNLDKTTPPAKHCPKKNPIAVSFYTNGHMPKRPYVVLGQETVSKFNCAGIKRQEASIHDAMRNLAANMGGDAVIDIKKDDKTITGTVVSYTSSPAVTGHSVG